MTPRDNTRYFLLFAFIMLFARMGSLGAWPQALVQGNVINILNTDNNGNVRIFYVDDGDKLVYLAGTNTIQQTDSRAMFLVARVEQPYIWLRPVKYPNEFIRHNVATSNVFEVPASLQYTLQSLVPNVGYENGGAWEKFKIVNDGSIMATRWDGASEGFLRAPNDWSADPQLATTKSHTGSGYEDSWAYSLTFVSAPEPVPAKVSFAGMTTGVIVSFKLSNGTFLSLDANKWLALGGLTDSTDKTVRFEETINEDSTLSFKSLDNQLYLTAIAANDAPAYTFIAKDSSITNNSKFIFTDDGKLYNIGVAAYLSNPANGDIRWHRARLSTDPADVYFIARKVDGLVVEIGAVPTQPAPGQLPVDGSKVAIKSGASYVTYRSPEVMSSDGSITVITANGNSSSDVTSQFIVEVVDATKGSFRLKTSDGRYVENLSSVVGIDKNATSSSPGKLLYYDKDGHIYGSIDPTLGTVWYPSYGLSNAMIVSNSGYSGWTSGAFASWIAAGNLRNCVNVDGKWVPAPFASGSIFSFETIQQTTTTVPTLSPATDLPDEGSIVAIKCIERNGYISSAETELKTNGTKDAPTSQFTIKNVNKTAATFQLIPNQGGYVHAGVCLIRMNQGATQGTTGTTLYYEKDVNNNRYISAFFDPTDPLNVGLLSATTGDTYAGWTSGTRAYWNSLWDWASLRNIVNKGTTSVVWNPATPLEASHFVIEVVKTPAQVTADTLASEKKAAADKAAAEAAAKAAADQATAKAAADQAAADAAAKAAADQATAKAAADQATAKAAADQAAADAAAKAAADNLEADSAADKGVARKQQIVGKVNVPKSAGTGRAVSTRTGRTTSRTAGVVATPSRGAAKTASKIITKKATSRR